MSLEITTKGASQLWATVRPCLNMPGPNINTECSLVRHVFDYMSDQWETIVYVQTRSNTPVKTWPQHGPDYSRDRPSAFLDCTGAC